MGAMQKYFKLDSDSVLKKLYSNTEFPKPVAREIIVYGNAKMNLEEPYYWIINFLRQTSKLEIRKTIDSFTPSVSSAFFGSNSQRLSAQQNHVAQFLRGISEMIKNLYQIIKDLRSLEQRLEIYRASNPEKEDLTDDEVKRAIAADITLKGIWVDKVEGGTQNPASVYGMANKLGFTILPDLFFRTYVRKKEDVAKEVDKNSHAWNEKVKEVLKRKLFDYYNWKEQTYKELIARERFTKKYIRQHYNTIRLYVSWIIPYLKAMKRLQANFDNLDSPMLTSIFDSNIAEIELLAISGNPNKNKYVGVGSFHFFYLTKPELFTFNQEYPHRGPSHTGRMEMVFRGYVFTKDDLNNYIKARNAEILEIISDIDETISDAMKSLGDAFHDYLVDIDEFNSEKKEKDNQNKDQDKQNNKNNKSYDVMSPFRDLLNGLKEIFGFLPKSNTKINLHPFKKWNEQVKAKDEFNAAEKKIKKIVFNAFKNYKKAHKYLTW